LHSPPAFSARHRENSRDAGELKALIAQIHLSAIIDKNMEQLTVTNTSAGKRPEYRTIENIISEETEVMASFIKDNEDKRLGLDRRQFSYDKHIPERRSGQDRRTNLIED